MTVDTGLGMLAAATLDFAGGPSAQMLKPLPLSSFVLQEDNENTDLVAFVSGKLVTQETFQPKTTCVLTIKTEIANFDMLGFALNEASKTFTGITIPIVKQAVVPVGGVINDADITAGNSASVIASITQFGTWGQAGPLTRVTVAPATGQVQVAVGTITCNVAQVGAPIAYVVNRTLTGRGYGGPGNPASLGDLQFSGRVFNNSATPELGGFIWIPRIQFKGSPTFTYDGNKVELEMVYNCALPTGWGGRPYLRLDGHSVI